MATVHSLKSKTSSVLVTKTVYVQCRKSSQKPFSPDFKHFTLKIHSCGQKALPAWRRWGPVIFYLLSCQGNLQQELKGLDGKVWVNSQLDCSLLPCARGAERRPSLQLNFLKWLDFKLNVVLRTSDSQPELQISGALSRRWGLGFFLFRAAALS